MKRTLVASVSVVFLLASAALLSGCASTGSDVPGPKAPAVDVSGFRSLGPALATTAQPTAEDFAAAKAAGYRTVVNFRPLDEPGALADEQAVVEGLGMRYVAIPVKGHGVEAAHADALDAVLADPSAQPCLMHCRSGTRAKAVWAIWLVRHGGATPDQALERAAHVGLSGDARTAVEKVIR